MIPHCSIPCVAIVVDLLEVLGVIVSLFIVNRYGRRPLLLHTMVFMTATLVVVGGLGIDRNRPVAANRAIAAMIMLCESVYRTKEPVLIALGLFDYPPARRFRFQPGLGS
jgi:hypothetical protein